MKKGFTLIEMIAVIGLIGLLTLLVLPNIMNQLGTQKAKMSDTTKKLIFAAADLYVSDSNRSVPGSVTLEELVDKGYLKKPLKDLNCGGEIPLNKIVSYSRVGYYNELQFEMDLSCNK